LIFLAQLLAGLPAACVVAERSTTWMRRSISASDTICRTALTSSGHVRWPRTVRAAHSFPPAVPPNLHDAFGPVSPGVNGADRPG
jgi:hypothetical protein